TDYTYTITGILSPREISISTRDLYSVYLDIDAARFIFNKAERDLPYIYKDYHVDYAIVKVAIIQEGPKIAEEIRKILGPGFTAVPLKETLLNRYKDTLAGLRDGLNLTQKLSLILIAVVTFNTSFIGAEERAHEIGVLRAIGASPFQVFWILFLETFTVSLLASFAGGIAGIAFGSLLLQHIFGPLLNVRMSFFVDTLPLLSGLQIGILASALGGILPAIHAGRGNIASFLATGLPPSGRNGSGILLLGIILVGIGLSPLLPVSPQPVTQILGGEISPLLSAVSLTMGLSCIIGYLIQRGGRIIGTILSFLFYKIGAITGRNMGRKSKRTVMCLLLLSTSMSFLITMSGIETNLTNGIENSLGGFLGADLIVVSDANFEKELAEKIFDLRSQADVEVVTPVYTDRQILYNSRDYRRYNIEGSLMLIEDDFFEIANIKFSPDTPNNIVPLLYSQLRVCIVTHSLAGTLNIRIGDHVAIRVVETKYDDLGNEYTEDVLEKLQVIGIAETTSFQYFTVGGASLDKVCMTPYSNWGHLHPQFHLEDELVKEDNSEEQLLATVILIKTKPDANLKELREVILEEFDDSYDIEKIVTREDLAEQYIGNVKAVFDAFKTAFYFSIGITV
ncbi:MAG: FtsX-like permease family protein, partial [Gammaproteobacteria bacterium]|nr:FtsX-like permease family protein [Gammaproteobacteria bacterium]